MRVYFRGQPRLRDGIYVKGVIDSRDLATKQVLIHVRQHAVAEPLSDAAALEIVQLQPGSYEQVFLLPEERSVIQVFAVGTTASPYRARYCDLPIILPEALVWPPRLSPHFDDFTPAFWVLPAGSYLYRADRDLQPGIRAASELCLRFKFGEAVLAGALALGIYEALSARGLLFFDCVTPMPLSPEKAAAGKANRARLLSAQVAGLLGASVFELLSLHSPISKGALRRVHGLSAAEFEAAYVEALTVDEAAAQIDRVLIIDDICNEGSTLSAALARVRAANHQVTVVAAVVGQIATRETIRDENLLFV